MISFQLRFIQKLYKWTKLPFTPFVGPVLLPLTTILGKPMPHVPGATTEEIAAKTFRCVGRERRGARVKGLVGEAGGGSFM